MTDSTIAPDDTADPELDAIAAAAADAARSLAQVRPADRAAMLRAVAQTLAAAEPDLVRLAHQETRLPETRLSSELARTTHQLAAFADVLDEGLLLEATIDPADPDAKPVPRPDLRRMVVPLGPVAVFAASNFPFAFSVAGGDTASALAAGCPVLLKAHPGHPVLGHRTGETVRAALTGAGAPVGSFATIFGLDAGRQAVLNRHVKAIAFTGSARGGRALFDLATSRPDPIPFYGEQGSLNPVFVTPGAARSRRDEIVRGYVASYTMGAGQFCTKPGLLFAPAEPGLLDALAEAVTAVPAAPMLNRSIREGYERVRDDLAGVPGVRFVVDGAAPPPGDADPRPTLLTTTVDNLLSDTGRLLEECFGPTSIVVEYDDPQQLFMAADAFAGSLTATVHAEADESALVGPLVELLTERAGRIVWNGWPTGVAVTGAMHHGGPYPATTSPLHTSVGTTAIRRFLRPVCFQDTPQAMLPDALRDDNPLGIPRWIDGTLTAGSG